MLMRCIMHFRLMELKMGFNANPIELLEDGTISFNAGTPHGKYIVKEDSRTINWHCKADINRVRSHTYHRILGTGLFMNYNANPEWCSFTSDISEPEFTDGMNTFAFLCPAMMNDIYDVGKLCIDFTNLTGILTDSDRLVQVQDISTEGKRSFTLTLMYDDEVGTVLTFRRVPRTAAYYSVGNGKENVVLMSMKWP